MAGAIMTEEELFGNAPAEKVVTEEELFGSPQESAKSVVSEEELFSSTQQSQSINFNINKPEVPGIDIPKEKPPETILRAPTKEEAQQDILDKTVFNQPLTTGTANPLPGQQPPLFQQASEQQAAQDIPMIQEEVKNVGLSTALWTKAMASTLLDPITPWENKKKMWDNFSAQEQSYEAPHVEALVNIANLGLMMYGTAALAGDMIGLAKIKTSQAADTFRLLINRERALAIVPDEELMANFIKMEPEQQATAAAFNERITGLLTDKELGVVLRNLPNEARAEAFKKNQLFKAFIQKQDREASGIFERNSSVVTETQAEVLSKIKPTEPGKIPEFVQKIGEQSPVIRDTITQAMNKKKPIKEITAMVKEVLYPQEKQSEITDIQQENVENAVEPVKPMVFETKEGKRITIEDIKPAEPPKTPEIATEPAGQAEVPSEPTTPIESTPVEAGGYSVETREKYRPNEALTEYDYKNQKWVKGEQARQEKIKLRKDTIEILKSNDAKKYIDSQPSPQNKYTVSQALENEMAELSDLESMGILKDNKVPANWKSSQKSTPAAPVTPKEGGIELTASVAKQYTSKPQNNVQIVKATRGTAIQSLPILQEAHVDATGTLTTTDLEVMARIHNTGMKPGMYRIIGNNFAESTNDPQDFPVEPEVNKQIGSTNREEFIYNLARASTHVSDDPTRVILSNVVLDVKDGVMSIVATDGKRLSVSDMKSDLPDGQYLIKEPAKVANLLKSIGGEDIKIYRDSGNSVQPDRIKFKGEKGDVIVTSGSGNYPSYKNIYPEENTEMIVDRKKLADALKELLPYARDVDKKMPTVSIVRHNENLYLKTSKGALKEISVPLVSAKQINDKFAGKGSIIMPAKAENQGSNEIRVNINYLMDSVSGVSGKNVVIRHGDNVHPLSIGGEYARVAPKPAAKPVKAKKKETTQFSMEEGEAPETIGRMAKPAARKMEIPPPSATGKMEWEKTEPWRVNQGRNIPGVFEREVAPHLKVSTRFKKWLGAYFPMLGEYGTIKVKKLNDMRVLRHETGHFIRTALGHYPVSAMKEIREDLMKSSQYLRPFEDVMIKKTYVNKKGETKEREVMEGSGYQKYRHSSDELFADFMGLYAEDAAKARELSPKFAEIIDKEYAKDTELKYIVDKLREFTEQFRPLQEYVDKTVGELAKQVPELQSHVKEFQKMGFASAAWNKYFVDPIWAKIEPTFDKTSKLPVIREFFVNKGLADAVYELLRMRNKVIGGQSSRFIEEWSRPMEKLSKEDQVTIAEMMQRFDSMDAESKDKLNFMTEYGRRELAYWGNEARKLGLLGEESFWNNVGQYFPFFYEVREFDALVSKYGARPSKGLSANLSMFKAKLTDEEMGRRVMEHKLGTFPSSKAKIDAMGKEKLEQIGIQAREDMGLIKSATYPVTKRVLQTIKTVTSAKMYNEMAKLPGVIGEKGDKGFAKMPEGKIYGNLSGQWVPEALLKEVNTWNTITGELEGLYYAVLNIYKTFKVPYSPTAMTRNLVTNMMMAWIGDTPIYNPIVMGKGIASFTTKNSTYKLLQNNGLYKHSFAAEELEGLHKKFMQANKNEKLYAIVDWAVNTFDIPSKIYGAVEDVSKTIMAQYALDNGASPAEAVKFADKYLFDYSEISTATRMFKKAPLPFATWTMKAIPVLLETAVRKPFKLALIPVLIALFNMYQRHMLGISEEDEEKAKPDYAKGRNWINLGKNDKGQLEWADVSYYLPWQNVMPFEKGKLSLPQSLKINNPLMIYMNMSNNYDPFTQKAIYPEYASYAEQEKLKYQYWIKSFLPDLAYSSPIKVYNSAKGIPTSLYSDAKQLDRLLLEMGTGSRIITENKMGQSFGKKEAMRNYVGGMKNIARRRSKGMISADEYLEYQRSLKEKFNDEIK